MTCLTWQTAEGEPRRRAGILEPKVLRAVAHHAPEKMAMASGGRANDLVFWHTRLHTDNLNSLAAKLRGQGVKFVSAFPTAVTADQAGDELSHFTKREMGSGRFLVRDPDGHVLELGELRTAAFLSR